MKWIVLLFLGVSCSSFSEKPSFSRKNCSSAGLSYMKATTKNSSNIPSENLKSQLKDFLIEKGDDVHKCYQAYLDKNTSQKMFSTCAVIGITKNGTLGFIDFSDEVNLLDRELKECIESKFRSYDYTPFKSQFGLSVLQPYNLYHR